MPAINTVPVPRYQPLDPYHHVVDNLPIDGLIERVFVVNDQVDVNTSILLDAIGTQGTLSNRLNQSLNPDGTLITAAVDTALHSIAAHSDGGGYVRMTLTERNKLGQVSSGATALKIDVEAESGTVPYVDNKLILTASDTITWEYTGGKVKANIDFPASVRHVHYYNIIPVTGDYQHYTTTSVPTAYKQGSLRVYVNGIRLNKTNTTYVPTGFGGTVTWSAFKFTEGTATSGVVTGGDFTMSSALSSAYRVVVDFDVSYP